MLCMLHATVRRTQALKRNELVAQARAGYVHNRDCLFEIEQQSPPHSSPQVMQSHLANDFGPGNRNGSKELPAGSPAPRL
jgi:hypothetical protein